MTIYCEKAEKAVHKNIVNVNVPSADVKQRIPWFETCSPRYLLLIVLLVASLLISLTSLVIFLTKYQRSDVNKPEPPMLTYNLINPKTFGDNTPTPVEHRLDKNFNLTSRNNLTIVTRQKWLALPPTQELAPLPLPVPLVIIMHTVTGNCSVQSSCSFIVQAIQYFHTNDRNWSDIGYNFLVGGDGLAYEGRGWRNLGAHTLGYNSKSIGIAFIGNFNEIMPPEKQILAAKELIQLGVEEGYIAPNYKLYAARQLQATQSPGLMLYEDVQKWPHWTKK